MDAGVCVLLHIAEWHENGTALTLEGSYEVLFCIIALYTSTLSYNDLMLPKSALSQLCLQHFIACL
jgi:hypothetical protein